MSFEPKEVIRCRYCFHKGGHIWEGKSVELWNKSLYFIYPLKKMFFFIKNCVLDFMWKKYLLKKLGVLPTKWSIYWETSPCFPEKRGVYIFMALTENISSSRNVELRTQKVYPFDKCIHIDCYSYMLVWIMGQR